jgi:hypothetical protein
MRCDVEVHHPSPLVSEDHEHEEYLVCHGRDRKEIKGDQVRHVILEERLPLRPNQHDFSRPTAIEELVGLGGLV